MDMNKMLRPAMSFVFVFIFGFFLSGWFLMPHLPPFPDHAVTVMEFEYWETNWAGFVVGSALGGLSAWSIIRKERMSAQKSAKGFPVDGSDVR